MSHSPAAPSRPGVWQAVGRWGPTLLWTLALAGLALLAGFTAWFFARALSYPYQLLYGEGYMLEFARRLVAGEPLYKPLDEFPLGTVNYPPLPLLLARIAFAIIGFGYAAGRIWAMLAALAIAALLYAWIRRATSQALPAVAGALAWLGAPYVYHWAPQFRVDLPGLAFSLAGIYLVWRKWEGRAMYAAAPLFVLGLYCKQSFIAAPAATVLALLLSRRRRQALIFSGVTLLLGGVPFLLLNKATDGSFWMSMVVANVSPFSLGRLVAQVAVFLRSYLPLLVLTALCLVDLSLEGWRSRESKGDAGPERLLVVYIVFALLTAALAGKAGSWENYFLEPLAVLCLGGGLGLARLRLWPAGRWLAPLLMILQVGLMWHAPAEAASLMRADAAANQTLRPRVAAESGLMLSEDAGLLVQAGKPVPYYDFQLSQLAQVGRWDQHWEVDHLSEGTFPMVIFEDDPRIDVEKYGRYTRAFMSALDFGYRPTERVGKYRIYRPSPLGRERYIPFEQGLALVGNTMPPAEVQPGQVISLDVVWQATEPMTQAYTSFLHLVDATGQGRTGDDHQPWDGLYPTSRWAEGEMVRMSYTLTLPVDLPPGLYTLNAGWYDDSLLRLRAKDGSDHVPLAVITVPNPQRPSLQPVDLNAPFENGVRLAGYKLARDPGALQLVLIWETDRFVEGDYVVFVHLRDAAGRTVSQGDGQPLGGAWPMSLWPIGYSLQDPHTVPLPANLPPGEYELVIGLYDPHTGQRVPLAAGGDGISLSLVTLP